MLASLLKWIGSAPAKFSKKKRFRPDQHHACYRHTGLHCTSETEPVDPHVLLSVLSLLQSRRLESGVLGWLKGLESGVLGWLKSTLFKTLIASICFVHVEIVHLKWLVDLASKGSFVSYSFAMMCHCIVVYLGTCWYLSLLSETGRSICFWDKACRAV